MELDNVLTAISSTAAGGAVVLLIAKGAIARFFRERDETARMLREVDRSLAVLSAHVDTRFSAVERDLNNLGSLIREMRK